MAQSSDSRSDPDDFIEDIDPGLLTYKNELYMRSVTSFATLKFLRPRELLRTSLPSKPSTSSKRLRYNNSPAKRPLDQPVTASPKVKDASDGYLEHEITKLQEQRDTLRVLIINKKDELDLKKVPPVAPKPLAIPGNLVSKLFCDNCHHKGHKSHCNKGNKSCPFPSCGGYNFCGLLSKHKEYRQELIESEKELTALEKKVRELDSQIKDMRSFMLHNTTNFVATVKPCLKAVFPSKYTGEDGALALQRDVRLVKISLNGKIPENINSLSKEKWESFLQRGRSSIFVATGESLNDEKSPQSLQVTSSGTVRSPSSLQCTQSASVWNAANASPIGYQPVWPYLQYPAQSQYAMDIQSNYVPSYGVGANYGVQPTSTITRPPMNQYISPPLPQSAPFAPPLPPGPPPCPTNL
ncbi:hypothetical protein FSP39_010259 [Pinctada imbricata]|uniref:Uncharacterized protein n=1 Tax=Pinctada imbricata TaxID=66713 RepID=A0AA88YI42_PINIB|nr:hypothetical protein FSP39_010259 [Pinctada imbricata]